MTRDQMLTELYAEFGAGRLPEEEFVRLEARIRAMPQRAVFWPERKRRKTRKRDPEHRRRLAYSGPMPPSLAARFTIAQLAVLRIVGDCQPCRLSVIEIAERAGVCVRVVQKAIKLAAGDGLVRVQVRRVAAARNDTNVVTVISPEWRQWLARGGCKRIHPIDNSGLRKEAVESGERGAGLSRLSDLPEPGGASLSLPKQTATESNHVFHLISVNEPEPPRPASLARRAPN